MQRFFRGTIAALLIAAMFVMPAFASRQTQDNQAIITSPTDGQAVSGVVPIFGTVRSIDFSRYELAYGPDPNPNDSWQPFATAEVLLSDAQLGIWDTNNLPPGTYAIRLRVIRSDGNFAETIVRGLQVGPAATETPAATPTDIPPAPTFESETQATIQPTVVIQQPPTSTPDLTTAGGAADDAGSAARRGTGNTIDLGRFTSAFVDGMSCAVGAFFVLGALVFGRWGLRLILRQMRGRSNQ